VHERAAAVAGMLTNEHTRVLIPSYCYLPFNVISNAPVDTNCPSTALQRKNIMIHEYNLFVVHHVHQEGVC
jgi:hypothetical protein